VQRDARAVDEVGQPVPGHGVVAFAGDVDARDGDAQVGGVAAAGFDPVGEVGDQVRQRAAVLAGPIGERGERGGQVGDVRPVDEHAGGHRDPVR
jgi:hypothetical protein